MYVTQKTVFVNLYHTHGNQGMTHLLHARTHTHTHAHARVQLVTTNAQQTYGFYFLFRIFVRVGIESYLLPLSCLFDT